MFKKIALALSAAAMTAIPVAAEAHGYYGGYGYPAPAYGYGYPSYGYAAPAYGYQPSYYGYDRYRCNRNTATGAVIGGVAGALLGRSLARGGHYSYRYDRYRHGNRTAGTLIGGAVGAVAGGAIASNNC
jgi:hypothetical protein